MGISNVQHRAPAVGYDTVEKEMYREKVWSTFAKMLNPDTAKVIIFPSKEGLEIVTAVKYGFKEENMIVIEEDSHSIHTSEWKSLCPNLTIYEKKLSEAVKDLVKQGVKIDAINFDSCSKISGELLNEVQSIQQLPSNSELLVGITLVKGREQSLPLIKALETNSQIPNNWDSRSKMLISNGLLTANSPYRYFHPLVNDQYKTPGSMPITYSLFALRKNGMPKF